MISQRRKKREEKKANANQRRTRSQIETEREMNAGKKNSYTFFYLIKLVNGGKRRVTGGRRGRRMEWIE